MSSMLATSSSEYSDESVRSLESFFWTQPKTLMESLLHDFSCLFLSMCAAWGIFNCDQSVFPFAHIAFICLALHGVMLVARSKFRNSWNWFEGFFNKWEKLMPITSILAMNLEMMDNRGSTREKIFMSILGTYVPIISQWCFQDNHDRVLDLTILSNACSLGFRSLEANYISGCLSALWHLITHIVAINSRLDPVIPVNFGLGIATILSTHCTKEMMKTTNAIVARRIFY